MSASPEAGSEQYEFDPVFLNSRREAKVIFCVWFLCMIWTVPVSWLMGYQQEMTPGHVETVLGIPKWTFWGVFLPWLAADIVTTAFCFRFLKEDDLGGAEEDEPASPANPVSSADAVTSRQEDAQ